MLETTFRAMGTTVHILARESGGDADVHRAFDEARSRIDELEDLLSRFRQTSDVSRLNAQAGAWVSVHPDTAQVLLLAKDAFDATKGVFNPCMGGVMESLGYHVSFEHVASAAVAERDRPVFNVPYLFPVRCPYDVDASDARVRLRYGYKIDLGGIAKGWIAKQAAKKLRQHGVTRFLLNAGGDIICAGTDTNWSVGIANPESPETELVTLDVRNLCLATSGSYLRRWQNNGQPLHHILDPFLGHPAQTDIVSSTVLHEDIVQAEVMAKVALILGSPAASEWLRGQSCKGWLFVKRDGEVMRSWN